MLKIKNLIFLMSLLGIYSNSIAQNANFSGKLSSSTNENEQYKYFLRVEGGTVEIFENKESGHFYAIRLLKSIARERRIKVDIGFIVGDAADGIKIAETGLEWLIFPHALISPFFGAGAGLIKEDILFGLFYKWNVGISLKIGRFYLRITNQKSTQISARSFIRGDKGPNYVGFGVDLGI